MNILKKNLDLIILFLIGLTVQITISEFTVLSENFHKYIYITFSLVMILYGILLQYTIKILNLKNSFLIILLAVILLSVISYIDFVIYPLLGGSTGQMYGIIYLFGFLPGSFVLGIVYGLYLKKN